MAIGWACAVRASHQVVLGTHQRQVRLAGVVAEPVGMESKWDFTSVLRRHRPDIVVHTASLTNVDECERDPERARHVNASLAENVAKATNSEGVRLIHISTDHLFAGDQAHRTEEDPPQPLNVYARTKLEAEQCVQQTCPDALIVRTNFFGWGPRTRRSFSDWILDNLRAGQKITLFEDVFFTPILIDALARTAHELLEQGVNGIVNVVGDDRVSKYEFGLRLARRFSLDTGRLRRGSIHAVKLAATRPADMSLDNGQARVQLGRRLGGVDDYLNALWQQEADGLAREIYEATLE